MSAWSKGGMVNGEEPAARKGARSLVRPSLPSLGVMGMVTLAGFLSGAGITAAVTRPWLAFAPPKAAPKGEAVKGKPESRPRVVVSTPAAVGVVPQVTVTTPATPLEAGRRLFWAAEDRRNRSRDLLAGLPDGGKLEAAAEAGHRRAVDGFRRLAAAAKKDAEKVGPLSLAPDAGKALSAYLKLQGQAFRQTVRLLEEELEARQAVPAAERAEKLAPAAGQVQSAAARARAVLIPAGQPVDNAPEGTP